MRSISRKQPRGLSRRQPASVIILLLVNLSLTATGCRSVSLLREQTPTAALKTSTPGVSPTRLTPSLNPPAATSAPLVSSIEIHPEDLRGVLIRFWHPWTGKTQQVVGAWVEEFNLSNPWGILVTGTPFPGFDALNAATLDAVDRDDFPHITAAFLHQALLWNLHKLLLDLNAYVNDPEWGLSQQDLADFNPLFWEHVRVEDRQLGIPAYQNAHLLIYNQSWADELGFSFPPTTTEQFRQQTCAAAQSYLDDGRPENNGMGGWIISTDPSVMLGWIGAFSGNILRTPAPAQGQSVYQFNTPPIQKSFTYLRGIFDDGCAWLPQAPASDLAFAGREGILATASLTELPHITEAFRNANNRDRWTVLPFPSPSKTPVIDVYGPSFYIFQASPEEQLAAWLFLRWISSPENNAKLVESNGAFPARMSAIESLQSYAGRYPQWASAVELLENANNEPAVASWGAVRRSLSDASSQLYRSYFTLEQVPNLLEYLDAFASELHLGPDLNSIFATPTPTPGSRPSRTPLPSASPALETPIPESTPNP